MKRKLKKNRKRKTQNTKSSGFEIETNIPEISDLFSSLFDEDNKADNYSKHKSSELIK